jgi:predicted lipoprotein with Yx(FWY)xxD motif
MVGRSRTTLARPVAVACAMVLALGIYGLGSAAGAATPSKAKAKATVVAASVPGVGTILVDAQGKTLYTLTDASGAAVECTAACASAWPPLTVAAGTKATAGKGVKKVTATSDGQVTWKALPLYRFAADTQAKEAKGNGLASFGGTWNVVKVKATKAGATATTKSSSGGIPGY